MALKKPRKPVDSHRDDDGPDDQQGSLNGTLAAHVGATPPGGYADEHGQQPSRDRNFFEGEDDRLRRAADDQRRSRAVDPSVEAQRGEGTMSSPMERRRSFRDEWTQEALPRLPKLDGWHLCWLSTTNQWDPISRRIRMGYTAVKPEELPGYEHLTQKSGQWEGCVGINEMILFKIPQTLFQQIMTEFHHDQPLDEESSIKNKTEAWSEGLRDSDGTPLVELEPDMQTLGRRPRRNPTFT